MLQQLVISSVVYICLRPRHGIQDAKPATIIVGLYQYIKNLCQGGPVTNMLAVGSVHNTSNRGA